MGEVLILQGNAYITGECLYYRGVLILQGSAYITVVNAALMYEM